MPKQWQLLLAETPAELPDGAILRYGVSMAGADAAFIDYDADTVQWVGAWTVHCEQRVGVRRASWTIQAHPRRLERLRGLRRAQVPFHPVHTAS